MDPQKAWIALTPVLVALLWAGCVRQGPIGDPIRFVKPVVAVESFENRAPFPLKWNLGDGMAESLIAALVRSGRVQVVSRSALPAVFQELDLQRDPRFRPEGRVDRGRLKNAQYLIRGTVVDFTHTAGGAVGVMRGLTAARLSSNVALVTVAVSVIDVESRQVFSETFQAMAAAAEASVESTYKGVAFGGQAFYQTPLGEATNEAIWKAVNWVVGQIASEGWQPRIARVEGDTIYLAGGQDRGMLAGETLEVREAGEPIRDPASGDEIGRRPERVVGRLRVTAVQDKMCVAEVVSGAGFQVGQPATRLQAGKAEMAR